MSGIRTHNFSGERQPNINWIVSHVYLHPYPFLLQAVSLSYYMLFLYFNLCLSVMLDHVHLHPYLFLLQAVPVL